MVIHVANNCVFVLDPSVTTTFNSNSGSDEQILGAAVGTFITVIIIILACTVVIVSCQIKMC